MHLTTQQDIDAPVEAVFAELSDLDAIERQAEHHGVDVQCERGSGRLSVGTRWRTRFQLLGKPRDADITIVALEPSESLRFLTLSGGLEAHSTIGMAALPDDRTRVTVSTELLAKTMSARLLVQSLKLAKGGLEERFSGLVARIANHIETGLKSPR